MNGDLHWTHLEVEVLAVLTILGLDNNGPACVESSFSTSLCSVVVKKQGPRLTVPADH